MNYQTIIHKTQLSDAEVSLVSDAVAGDLKSFGDHYRISHQAPIDSLKLEALRASFDINPLPLEFSPERVKLLVCDMDSTLISIECIDELADVLNVKAEVSKITEAAMRGELVFAEALQRRVALLKGLAVEDMDKVYRQRLKYNPGAKQLIASAKALGITTAVVSGGFSFFTQRVSEELGLDAALSNELEIEEGRLTGRLLGAIAGAETKAEFLIGLRDKLGIESSQCIAIGDGANDIPMLSTAGLGVAYHAKPNLKKVADALIDHNGLDAACAFFSLNS